MFKTLQTNKCHDFSIAVHHHNFINKRNRGVTFVGDELLRIDISVVRQLSLDDARAILHAAASCPVRLTLLRRRHHHLDHDHAQADVLAASTSTDRAAAASPPRLSLIHI